MSTKRYQLKITDLRTGEVRIKEHEMTDSQVAKLVAAGAGITPVGLKLIGKIKA